MAEFVFSLFAGIAVVSAVMCVAQRSPIAALLWLVQVMLSLGAIFVLLGAEFIGLIQILVYAGAIMVLFLFIIMLLKLGSESGRDRRAPPVWGTVVVIVGLLVAELAALWAYTPRRIAAEVAARLEPETAAAVLAGGERARQAVQARGVVGGIAAPLFQTYLVPFEITSVLLLAAIVGAVVLAKRKV